MPEKDFPSQEERCKFIQAVPDLLTNGFGNDPQIVRIGSNDLMLSARTPGKDKITTSLYELVGDHFRPIQTIIDGNAIKAGVIQTPLIRSHFSPLEE